MSRIKLCDGIFQTSRVPWMGLAGSSTSWSRNHWKRLTHAPAFPELCEHELNRFANASVGMKHNLAHRVQHISDRKPFEQLTTPRLGLLPRLHSLPQDLQFDDAECPLDTKHQLVIEIIQVIDLLLVGNESSEDLAHLQ